MWPLSGHQALRREEECQTFMWSILNLNERKLFCGQFLLCFNHFYLIFLFYLHFCFLSHFKRIRCIMKLLITSSMYFLLEYSWKNKTWNAKCAPPLFSGGWASYQVFQKGGLDRISIFRGGLHWKKWVTFFKEGCSFYLKNKLKLIFMMTLKTYGTLKMFLLSAQNNFYVILSSYVKGHVKENQLWISCLWLVSSSPKSRWFFREFFVDLVRKSFSGRNNSREPPVFWFSDSLPYVLEESRELRALSRWVLE